MAKVKLTQTLSITGELGIIFEGVAGNDAMLRLILKEPGKETVIKELGRVAVPKDNILTVGGLEATINFLPSEKEVDIHPPEENG